MDTLCLARPLQAVCGVVCDGSSLRYKINSMYWTNHPPEKKMTKSNTRTVGSIHHTQSPSSVLLSIHCRLFPSCGSLLSSSLPKRRLSRLCHCHKRGAAIGRGTGVLRDAGKNATWHALIQREATDSSADTLCWQLALHDISRNPMVPKFLHNKDLLFSETMCLLMNHEPPISPRYQGFGILIQ